MQNMQKRVVRLFLCSAAVVLLTTALAKALSALGDARILQGPDPIFGMDIRTVLLVAATLESFVAWVCLRAMRPSLQVGLVLWLSTAFLLYRAGLWMVGYDRPCNCLGTLTDALGISPEAADLAAKLVLAYLFIGSCAARFWLRGQPSGGSHDDAAKPVDGLQLEDVNAAALQRRE